MHNTWRVRLDGTRGGKRGTLGAGFLVDSRRVLTCEHVVRDAANITVTFGEAGRKDLEGMPVDVIFEGPWRDPDDPGDVAVVELTSDIDIMPARLESLTAARMEASPDRMDDLRAHGYPSGSGEAGTILRARITSQWGTGEWTPIEAARGYTEFPRQGFSGAAVYDETTGRVFGMITEGSTSTDIRIGRMLPVDTIRRYWEELDDLLNLGWFPRAEEARTLRQIVHGAAIDGSGSYTELVLDAFPHIMSRPRDLRSVWDAIRYTVEEVFDDTGGHHLAHLLTQVESRLTDQAVRARLRAWRLANLQDPPELTGQSASIFVRVDPAKEEKIYLVSFSALVDGIAGPSAQTIKATADMLRAMVEREMPQMMERMGGRDPVIEFALPRDLLLKKRVDEWRADSVYGIPINNYQVVVRDVARLNRVNGTLRNQWILRSKQMRTFPWQAPYVIACGRKPAEIYLWLQKEREVFLLVLTAKPTLSQLQMILNAGVPAAFWPHGRCNDGDHALCKRRQLADSLKEQIEHASFDELPGLARDLRLGRGNQMGSHLGRELTLLWDDPGRIPPDPPTFMDGDHG